MADSYPTPSSAYPEHEQIRDLQYMDRLPASRKPDPMVVIRLIKHGLVLGIDYARHGEACMYLTPRGGELMLKVKA